MTILLAACQLVFLSPNLSAIMLPSRSSRRPSSFRRNLEAVQPVSACAPDNERLISGCRHGVPSVTRNSCFRRTSSFPSPTQTL